jgi:hypothetical protein
MVSIKLMILQNSTVPLLGLPQALTLIILNLIAIVGSIIAVFLFPRVFTPLFLRLKGLIRRKYKDAYIEIQPRCFSRNMIIRRWIYIFLLELGILAFLVPAVNPALFLSLDYGPSYYESLGVPPEYTIGVLMSLTSMTLPFVNGLWSIGWVMEDAGLMHYKFEKEERNRLYEIEPVYRNYSYYLKGYAGISSVLFLYNVVIAWVQVTSESRIEDIVISIFLPAIAIILSIPSYLIYGKFVNKKFIIKQDLKQLQILDESQILEE